MKIIHCSDVHLGSNMLTHLDYEKATLRKAEILNTFLKMIEYAKSHQIDTIIIAGDLLDADGKDKHTCTLVLDIIRQHQEIRFYYLPGNHDEHGLTNSQEKIPDNLYMFGTTWTTYSLSPSINICGAMLGDNADHLYDTLNLPQDQFNIVVLHGYDIYGNRQTNADEVNFDKITNKNIDYLAMGHIHAYKEGKLGSRGKYIYPGCLEGRGFDECGDKGFVIMDIENKKCTTQFVPFAFRKLHQISVDITNIYSFIQIKSAITDALKNISSQDFVRVVLVGDYDQNTDKQLPLLNTSFQHYYYFEILDESKPKIDLTQLPQQNSLLGEFVRLVNDSDLSQQERDEIIILGLKSYKNNEV